MNSYDYICFKNKNARKLIYSNFNEFLQVSKNYTKKYANIEGIKFKPDLHLIEKSFNELNIIPPVEKDFMPKPLYALESKRSLKDFDAKFDYAEGVYTFKDDSEALYLDRLVQSKYPETLTTERQTVITTSFKSNQDISSITSAIKKMAGVIDVLDSVSGQLLIKTQGKTYLNLNEPALQSIRIAACRAIFTPTEFRPDVQIEGLSVNGASYIFSTNDSYSFSGAKITRFRLLPVHPVFIERFN